MPGLHDWLSYSSGNAHGPSGRRNFTTHHTVGASCGQERSAAGRRHGSNRGAGRFLYVWTTHHRRSLHQL